MTSPEQYTPRDYSALDVVQAAKRTADLILRSNPLTNAQVTEGLLRFVGNHTDVNGDKVNFLWIGEFLPADSTMGGIPQRGIVMWRDDSTAATVNDGVVAFALYDHDPGGSGLGLRQTIHSYSVDKNLLYLEARHGGLLFPHAPVAMYDGSGTDRANWPSVVDTSFVTAVEGFVSCIGNHVYGRFWTATPGGVTGEFRMTASWSGGSVTGTTFTQGAASLNLREDTLNVTGARGQADLQVKVEARVTSGAGPVQVGPISFRNFTNDT